MPDRVQALAERLRDAWVQWAMNQPHPKPSWLVPWDQLDEASRSADVALAEAALAYVEETLPTRGQIAQIILDGLSGAFDQRQSSIPSDKLNEAADAILEEIGGTNG